LSEWGINDGITVRSGDAEVLLWELGEGLKARCNNIRFTYLPTVIEGNVPRYTYKLQEGITTDRQGLIIIENEKILYILRVETSPLRI
jgi:hypothetical protein